MTIESVNIDVFEAYRYMGCFNNPDDKTVDELKRASELITNNCTPRYISKICKLNKSDGISLDGTVLKLTGKNIKAMLHDSDECIIFCATIGNGFEPLLRQWQIRDITFAAMLDACASSAIESVCNNIENYFKEKFNTEGKYLTDRFSPGYGDLPIEIQKDFCASLDTDRKIGVSVTESGIMLPRKSVTAVMGISSNVQRHRDIGCAGCVNFQNCKFREKGVTCYGQAL